MQQHSLDKLPYMQAKIDAGYEDITGNWPLPEEPIPEPVVLDPTEKLRLFLANNPDVLEIL